ncbi:protein of unknown function [Burkholderia multivorans]
MAGSTLRLAGLAALRAHLFFGGCCMRVGGRASQRQTSRETLLQAKGAAACVMRGRYESIWRNGITTRFWASRRMRATTKSKRHIASLR